MSKIRSQTETNSASLVAERLRKEGLDANRLARHRLGWPNYLLWRGYAPWVWTALLGFGLWLIVFPLEAIGLRLPPIARSLTSLIIGFIILKSACDALIAAVERLAARKLWNYYVAGTLLQFQSL